MTALVAILDCFEDNLVEPDLGPVTWVALYMVWIPFWLYYFAHVRESLFRTFVRVFMAIPLSVRVLLIVYYSSHEKSDTSV